MTTDNEIEDFEAIVTIVEHNRQQREKNKSFAEGWKAGYQAAKAEQDGWRLIDDL